MQEVSGGSGFSAQNDRRLHFGLGAEARVDRAVIHWPSGRRQELEAPAAGRVHRIQEPVSGHASDAPPDSRNP
jgi:enediyne biosynthesis protein E4